MKYFGNEFWNKAIDNNDKIIIPLNTKDVEILTAVLDKAGINYYGYSQESISKIAINSSDIKLFRQLVGSRIADSIHYQRSSVAYTPPEKNIIGNSEYRYISDKKYFQADTDTILKMAEIMQREGIKFSGRIYGSKSKLTVRGSDIAKLHEIKNSVDAIRKSGILSYEGFDEQKVEHIHDTVIANRSSVFKPAKQAVSVGNLDEAEITQKEYYKPNLSSEHFDEIKIFIDMQLKDYAATVNENGLIFCANEDRMPALVGALRTAERQYQITMELLHFSTDQLVSLIPAAKAAAENGETSILNWVNTRDSVDSLNELAALLKNYYELSEDERYTDENHVVSDLLKMRKKLDNEIKLYDICAPFAFSEEQKELIRQGLERDYSTTILEEIDNKFTTAEITLYYDKYEKAVHGEISANEVKDYLAKVRAFHRGEISEDPTLSVTDNTAAVEPLSVAQNLINDFCVNEYGSEADFSDLSKIGIAYTTTEDGNSEIQVNVNLNEFSVIYQLDGKVYKKEQYTDIEDMIANSLTGLDFNELVAISDDELEYLSMIDHLKDVIPDIPDDTAKKLIVAFDGAALHGWESGDNQAKINRIKKALYDVLERDEQTEKAFACIAKHKYNVSFEREITWEAVPDSFDENGKATLFSTKVNDTFFWLEPTENGYAITMEYGDGSVRPISEEYASFASRTEAEDYFFEDMDNITSIADRMKKNTELSSAEQEPHETPELTMHRIGDFWEFFGNDAQIAAEILDLHIVQRKGEDMVGIPNHIKDTYSNKLREAGYTIKEDNSMTQTGVAAKPVTFEDHSAETLSPMDTKSESSDFISEIEQIAEEQAALFDEPLSEVKFNNDKTLKFVIEETEDKTGYNVHKFISSDNGDTYEEPDEPKFYNSLTLVDYYVEGQIKLHDEGQQISMFDAGEEPAAVNKLAENEVNNTADFTIEDETLGEGGSKTKFRANIEAIKILKQIETEERAATAEEKETMSKYVGWGGLSNAFNPENESWKNEFIELKDLLTDSEYSSARASVLDSFYTSPVIIDGVYAALSNMGFEGGNVLEPALGVGNFIGRMPQEMSKNSKFYGTEIDSLSGRIAQKIYPNADIRIEGFEKNKYQKNCFDIAVGNVPFGDLGFKDTLHNTSKLHDYFFAETLDKVKAGGLIAFVTSSGTLDKKDETVRKMLSERADLVGAVRLPNNTFKANAGTEVTSDVIFLQKRNTPPEIEPEWVKLGSTEDGLTINKYYETHPDMVLGKIVAGNKLYGRDNDTMCVPIDGTDLKQLMLEAVGKLSAQISDVKAADVYPAKKAAEVTPPEELKNFSLFEYDNKIYFKTADKVYDFKYDKTNKQHARARAFIALRDTTRELLRAQEENRSESDIKSLQTKLNELYDDFYAKYGLINSAANKRAFREDFSYNLVATLEKEFTDDKLVAKSDIFTKRTIVPAQAVDHVDEPSEALALSLAEKTVVDFDYMSSLTNMTKEQLVATLKGEIYEVPFSNCEYQSASEYLSGDIREKLHIAEDAASQDERFSENVAALSKAMPEPLKAGDIDARLGATWIDTKYYEQFMYETFGTPYDKRSDTSSRAFWRKPQKIEVEYSPVTNQYNITNKRSDRSVSVTKNFGTDKINAYEIMESLLNLKDPKITKIVIDPVEGKEKRMVDIEATRLAQKKADKIRSAFKDWIFDKQERREELVNIYNERFNSIRPREYDGSRLRFPQMNSDITMQEHQKNAIAHALCGNALFAHSVGAGKSFEMIASAMEAKRLGLCTKTLMCVPNHLTEQIGSDFMKLYPSANILVATKNDFTKNNRQQLFAKIATGNYDAVIIGHSQLKMIPMNKERQEAMLQGQIDDITEGIQTYKQKYEDKSFNVKAMERTRKGLQKQLDELRAKKQDDLITFEEMGIDKLIVDEAHEFKNLFTPTKMQNVSGISSSASQKSLDLFMKCQYLDEKTGGKGIILATGTPLSNSVTELHTMMRFLEYDFLKSKDLHHFDNFIAVFGQQKTDWELAPAGNKFKQRTRIAEFSGLPELMSMFKQVADVRTADTLKLKVPECETHIVNVEATEFQKTLVQELADRADDVQDGKVEPTVDNMLRITSDGRKLGLDPRLIDPSFEDDPSTKLNQCVNNVFDIYKSTETEKLTQIVFCDLGVPHKVTNDKEDMDEKSVSEQNSLEEECDFCVYDDIREKLIAKGVSKDEIAFIHDAKNEKQKTELFERVRKGEVRVLLGSTPKMGTGTNVQDKLIAIHDLDIPWRPADLEQRKGRIVRQGNQNEKVHVYRYVTKGTFDAYSYQTLENKQQFISQIMTSKTPVRRCEDVDQQALSYAEIKTLCTGDERIKEKMQLDSEVKGLQIERAEYINTKHDMEDKVKFAPKQEQNYLSIISNLKKDKEHLMELPPPPEFALAIGDKIYGNEDRTEAAKAFEKAFFSAVNRNPDKPVKIGEFQGMPLMASSASMNGTFIFSATLNGAAMHKIDIGASFANNIKRLEGVLAGIDQRISDIESRVNALHIDVAEAEKIIATPFAHEEELKTKSERLDQLTEELNKAAMTIKENSKGRQRTNFFDVAKLKKEAAKCRNTLDKQQNNGKKKVSGIED